MKESGIGREGSKIRHRGIPRGQIPPAWAAASTAKPLICGRQSDLFGCRIAVVADVSSPVTGSTLSKYDKSPDRQSDNISAVGLGRQLAPAASSALLRQFDDNAEQSICPRRSPPDDEPDLLGDHINPTSFLGTARVLLAETRRSCAFLERNRSRITPPGQLSGQHSRAFADG